MPIEGQNRCFWLKYAKYQVLKSFRTNVRFLLDKHLFECYIDLVTEQVFEEGGLIWHRKGESPERF